MKLLPCTAGELNTAYLGSLLWPTPFFSLRGQKRVALLQEEDCERS